MAKVVTLRDANQRFAQIVREVEQTGVQVIVTRRGIAVASIGPVRGEKRELTPEQTEALDQLFKPAGTGSPKGWKFSRDELYDEATDAARYKAKPKAKAHAVKKSAPRRG